MALLRCDFFSAALGMSTSMTVLLPESASGQIGMGGSHRTGEFPTLYLLHGLSDDDTTWVRRTSLERYVSELGLAVVMPQVQRSFYADEVFGRPYWTFVADELPRAARGFFRLSARREDTFVAGLSMGGYGAFKLALRHPDRFAAAASLSGVLDLAGRVKMLSRPEDPRIWQRIFGDPPAIEGTGDDLLHLLREVENPPALYLTCGTEDVLHPSNVVFRDACAAQGVPLTVDFSPGEHEWGFWDAKIRDVLAWLPLR
ncbi:alpha/beta hydrolase family protein [Dactylosporangium fulvum]|uniref:Esterase family protein n=1 Tax=Dactylosporangium fulvum TaxID=53359 RepID=A0ABY5WAB8_9ACTN|nr:alpha/beta hydrolase family protein [Dactylosporangium fulvum]UWP85016.1 esterase family protein [Dactylosporangium fulvum]